MSTDIQNLQNSANSFAALVNMPQVAVTGVIDNATTTLVQAALAYCAGQSAKLGDQAQTAQGLLNSGAITTPDQLANSASGVSTFLDQCANGLGLELSFSTPGRVLTAVTGAFPLWVWVAGGLAATAAFIAWYKHSSNTTSA